MVMICLPGEEVVKYNERNNMVKNLGKLNLVNGLLMKELEINTLKNMN